MTSKASLSKKIDALFTYRKIPWLIELSQMKGGKQFLQKLKKLQTSIYFLDYYLETTWDIKKKALKEHWKDIYARLAEFGLSKKEQKEWGRQIEKYQEHELGLRANKSPVRYAFRHLYYYKSCDVRLMRKLIYRKAPELNKSVLLSDWTNFDLITEINDDIDDVYEDMDIINGNRLLFELKENGKAKTKSNFRKFIKEIHNSNISRFKGQLSGAGKENIYPWTVEIIQNTSDLLDQRIREIKVDEVAKATVFSFMN